MNNSQNYFVLFIIIRDASQWKCIDTNKLPFTLDFHLVRSDVIKYIWPWPWLQVRRGEMRSCTKHDRQINFYDFEFAFNLLLKIWNHLSQVLKCYFGSLTFECLSIWAINSNNGVTLNILLNASYLLESYAVVIETFMGSLYWCFNIIAVYKRYFSMMHCIILKLYFTSVTHFDTWNHVENNYKY